jgi:ankyrin repeat protein
MTLVVMSSLQTRAMDEPVTERLNKFKKALDMNIKTAIIITLVLFCLCRGDQSAALASDEQEHLAFLTTGFEAFMNDIKSDDDINRRDIGGRTALHMAVYIGAHSSIIDSLIARGADVNLKDSIGNTPLHYASIQEYSDCYAVEALLKAGVDSNAANFLGWTPLHIAAWEGRAALVSQLIDHGADISKMVRGQTPLIFAAGNGHKKVAELLVKAGAVKDLRYHAYMFVYAFYKNSEVFDYRTVLLLVSGPFILNKILNNIRQALRV